MVYRLRTEIKSRFHCCSGVHPLPASRDFIRINAINM